MSSIAELASFAARLRGFICACASAAAGAVPSFDRLALELFALQYKHNGPYRRLCEARGAVPENVTHWTGIPAAPTSAFKGFELSCLPVAERTKVFHSSGTTAQRPSRHFHNAESLAVYEASLLRWFEGNIQLPMANSQWVMLSPPPTEAPHSSLVHMFEAIRPEAGLDMSAFVGRVGEDGGWELELEAVVERLSVVSGSGQPMFMLGTAFSFVHLLDYLAEQELWFEVPPGSCAMETGGYKGRSRSLPKAELHTLISRRLGIAPSRIICEYGMSELSSQAYDVGLGFHFPPWARVQVISPETGREVGEGETGLIRVFDLANVYSVMAVQTEDLGTRGGDGFALAGRAVLAEPRGCSLMAV
jgi:hypothetical protein